MEYDLCFGCMEHTGANGGVCPECGFDPAGYTTEPHQLRPGTLLKERYAVGRVLGEGGFGITYVGRDTLLDLKVAIKEFYMSGYVNRNNTYSTVVQASMGTHAETFAKNREKFLQEARVLAKFANEDGIVGIRDFFQENNTAYIVMDFLSGGTMRDYLNRVGPLTWEQTHRILRPILVSLGNVHAHNIIHRDISPDNIMMTGDGKVKLLDFGAAREISKTDIKSLSVILKPGYAPEEQYRSKGQQGPWTDIYALCATMYRCMTGEVPDDSMERMYNDQVKSPFERGVCPVAISNVLMKGLSVRQVNRYQSIAELCADIELAERDPDNAAIAAPAAPQGQRPVDPNATVYAGADAAVPVRNEPATTDPNATVYAGAAQPVSPTPVRRPADAGTVSASDVLAAQTAGKPVTKAPTKVPGKEPTRAPAKVGKAPAAKPGLMQDAVNTADRAASGTQKPKAPAAVFPQQPKAESAFPAHQKGAAPAAAGAGKSAPVGKAPKAPKAPKEPKAKTEGKKKSGLFLIIPAVILVIVAVVFLLNAGKKPSGTIPYPFDDFSFTLNDKTYELPIMLEDLEKDGWIAEDKADLEGTLSPNYSKTFITLTNGYGEINVSFRNPTDNTLNVTDCPIYYVFISYHSLTQNYLNEVRNFAEIANGMELGSDTASSFTSRAPKGYGIDKKYDLVYTYEDESKSNVYYEVQFDKDDKLLRSVTISAPIPDDFVDMSYSTTAPDDFDEAAFEAEAQLQWAVYVEDADAAYATSIYLNDLLSVGWEMENGPEYVASGDEDTVYLRASTLLTMEQKVFNPFHESIVPKYCFVDDLTVWSSDLPAGSVATISGGGVEITTDMSRDEVLAVLEAGGITRSEHGGVIEETGAVYVENGTLITVYPHGTGDLRYVELDFLDDGGFMKVGLYSADAVEAFFDRHYAQ